MKSGTTFFWKLSKCARHNGREIVFEVVEEQNSSLQLVRISNNTIFSKSKNRTKGGTPCIFKYADSTVQNDNQFINFQFLGKTLLWYIQTRRTTTDKSGLGNRNASSERISIMESVLSD